VRIKMQNNTEFFLHFFPRKAALFWRLSASMNVGKIKDFKLLKVEKCHPCPRPVQSFLDRACFLI